MAHDVVVQRLRKLPAELGIVVIVSGSAWWLWRGIYSCGIFIRPKAGMKNVILT